MFDVDFAIMRMWPWRKGSVLDCFILTSMWVGDWESGTKVISWAVKWTAGLKGPLQVNSLELRKPKKARVKAAYSMTWWWSLWSGWRWE